MWFLTILSDELTLLGFFETGNEVTKARSFDNNKLTKNTPKFSLWQDTL